MESSDKSKQVNWSARKDADATVRLTFTSSGAYNTSGLTLSCGIYENGSLVFSPTIANGGATGIVDLGLANLSIQAGEYFWKLSTTSPLDLVLLQGVFVVNDYLWDGGTNTSGSVIVNINGTNVTISISLQ